MGHGHTTGFFGVISKISLSSHLCLVADYLYCLLASIVLTGQPLQLVDELQGQIWSKTVSQAEAVELEQQLPVISKRLFAGRTVLNVFAISQPAGFSPCAANLEDVYFSSLHQARQRQSA